MAAAHDKLVHCGAEPAADVLQEGGSKSMRPCASQWRRAMPPGRVPFTELLNQCGAAEGGPPASLVGATPCMSALALHKLSLESAQPPSRVHGCWKGGGDSIVALTATPSPRPGSSNNPKRKLLLSPTDENWDALSRGPARRRSHSMPHKRHRPHHDSHSLPACLGEPPGISGTTSPLHGIRSSISAPEPLLRDASLRGGSCCNPAPALDLPRTDFGPGFLAYVQSQNVFGAPSTPLPGAAPNHPDCCSAGELRPCEGDEEAAVQHLGCPAAAALPSPCRGGLAEMFASVAAVTDAPGVDAASSPSTAAAVGTAAHPPCPAARSVPSLMDERGAQQMCQPPPGGRLSIDSHLGTQSPAPDVRTGSGGFSFCSPLATWSPQPMARQPAGAICPSPLHKRHVTPGGGTCSPDRSLLPQVEDAQAGLPSIGAATLAALLQGDNPWGVERLLLYDCRYTFEFEGGCVVGATNMQDPAEVEAATLKAAGPVDWTRTAVVMYCEFSSERAPRMVRHLRQRDRQLHFADYPALTVPHVYVLSRGYKGFLERYPELCAPEAGYVRMVDDRFAAELRQQLNASKTAWGGKDGRKKAARPCRTPYSPL